MQIFDTSRKLGVQGWSFAMHASMLEIYNEEYRDLLSRSRKADKKHQVRVLAAGPAHGALNRRRA